MPAYNFSPEFADDVEHRRKRSTIRLTDKGSKVGDTAYLYTGQRTKECRLLGTSTLVAVEPIEIMEFCIYIGNSSNAIYEPAVIDLIARSDGFKDYADMAAWFKAKYNIKSLTETPFVGFLHVWS